MHTYDINDKTLGYKSFMNEMNENCASQNCKTISSPPRRNLLEIPLSRSTVVVRCFSLLGQVWSMISSSFLEEFMPGKYMRAMAKTPKGDTRLSVCT